VITLLELIATAAAALFAGAALYINVVEHPVRMSLDTASALAQWAASYRRATWLQAPLAVLSFATGLSAWVLGGNILWAIAAVLIGLVVPFTFVGIMPTNHKLLAPGRNPESAETRVLLNTWAKLHAVRTVLSLAATALYLWCALAQ
jgi:anthrone oxygenase-like protein